MPTTDASGAPPLPRGSALRNFCEPEFEQMPKEALLELQFGRFCAVFEQMFETNPFYRARYLEAGVTPAEIRTRDDLRRVPVVRKKEVLADAAEHPPFGSRLGVPLEQIVQVVESAGTSGIGKEVQALSRDDLEAVVRAKLFHFVWPGCREGTVVALNSPVSMSSGPYWNLFALERIGASPLRLGMLDTTGRLHAMRTYAAEVMQASPAYLMRLEYAARAEGLDPATDLPALRTLFVTGGGWTIPWAQERARIWNARLYEVYANSQRAFCYTCELGMIHDDRPGVLHHVPHLHLLEVVDPETGRHVENGEEGEIVVTAFDAAASPIVRYATGDRAVFRAAETCACGRAFDGIEAGSVARYDDMLRVKEVNLWPLSVDEVLFANAWLAEYRGEVDVDERGREVVRVRVEFDSDADAATRAQQLRALASALKDRTRLNFEVLEWSGESLRAGGDASLDAASLKIRRWTDRRKETMAGR